MKPTFVVLADLSPSSEAALTYTANLASHLDGHLVLLHVYLDPLLEPEASMVAAPVPPTSRQQIIRGMTQRAQYLPVPAEVELSLDTLETAVADAIARHHPAALVVGREQPHNAFDRLVTNLALPVLQDLRYPLLLVPEQWKDSSPPTHVAVAADGHRFQLTRPSLVAGELLMALRPATTVVHVAAAHGPSRADVGLEAVHQTGLFGKIGGNNLYEVREEAPTEGILHAAADLNAELLVVMARPHTFLGGLFHRSVTAQLLRQSAIPVLVLPTLP